MKKLISDTRREFAQHIKRWIARSGQTSVMQLEVLKVESAIAKYGTKFGKFHCYWQNWYQIWYIAIAIGNIWNQI